MKVVVPLAAVFVLLLFGLLGGAWWGLGWIFGILIPYAAVAVFLGGMSYRVWDWAKTPVPFRIPTTCGQQKSLSWIKQAKLDNPSSALGVLGRVFLEVVFFRSLLRNTTSKLLDGGKLAYVTSIWLWLGAVAFHWTLLLILFRHLRFFTNPVPSCVTIVQELDGFLEVGVPVFYVTTVVFLAAMTYLFVRRMMQPQLRYISLLEDYFVLFLLLGIGLSGFWLRHVAKTDIGFVKELAVGLISLRPTIPATTDSVVFGHYLFYGHFFLVSVLLAYIPFSKMVHMAGAFLSPTRSMANNNRMVRHVNPWDYRVKVHTYDEYEDELRDKMKGAGVPVEKE